MVASTNPSGVPTHGSSFASRRDGCSTLYLHSLLELLIHPKQFEAKTSLFQVPIHSVGNIVGAGSRLFHTTSLSEIHQAEIQARIPSDPGSG